MDPFIAEIRMFTGTYAPKGWALCNGQLLPISQNTALFSLIGTIYGGDGRTTFALPNLQERVPIHWGTGPGLTPREIGERGGSATVTLTTAQLPAHGHLLPLGAGEGLNVGAAGQIPAGGSQDLYAAEGSRSLVGMNLQSLSSAGGGAPHSNLQPFLVLQFIIALQGIYPPRG